VAAVVRVGERVAADRFEFHEVTPILGDRPGPWVVRMTEALADSVDPEQEYVIAFTDWIPDPNFKTNPPSKDPDGFKLISVSLVGECLVPAVKPVRELFLAPDGYFDDQREHAIDIALAALISGDPAVQRFGAGELALRTDLAESYSSGQQSIIRKSIVRSQGDTVARSSMMAAALTIPPQPKFDWLPVVARNVLSTIEPQFSGDANLPALAVAGLQALGARGSRNDCDLVAPFLLSNQTGVAASALRALEKLHPKTAAREAQAALAKPDLPSQSRRDFEAFVQKMEIRGIEELRRQQESSSLSNSGVKDGDTPPN
jgi:hypothetical protein